MLSLTTVEYVTNTATFLMFCTGIPPCLNMMKTGSTKNVPFVLFLIGSVSCTNSMYYGREIGNSSIMNLNGLGAILQIIYALTYLAVTKNKLDCVPYFLLFLLYFCSVYYYLYSIVIDPDLVRENVGIIASTICTMMLFMPVTELPGNIINKNADGVPAVMLVGSCICSICWLTYGYLLQDVFIYGPNFVGICVAFLKLLMFPLYGGSKTKTE
ncbi:unnamed protein product [Owenia fusiformis]|uniref:Sugar transporter SWEET1 n=1 Tax=Owenia fusiformis TaxID=6347 RepID=A0A8J1TWK8_OWEFU|nr:unnamed protein product [Owenia fusiformis]